MREIFSTLLFVFLFSGCQNGNSETETIDLITEIELPTKSIKRVTSTDIDTITITVFDSEKSYYKNEPFESDEAGWRISLYDIPVDKQITFLAEAKDSEGFKILEGEVTKSFSKTTSSLIIPISVSTENDVIAVPFLESAVESDGGGTTNLTFKVSNPNADFITWKVIPDPEMAKVSEVGFEAIDGTKKDDGSIEGDIDFSEIVNDSVEIKIGFSGDLGNIIYNKNQFVISNSLGDQTISLFSLFSPRDEAEISLAPIEEKIYVTFYEDKLEAKALIYGDFPRFGEWGCENDFETLSDFKFSDQTYENLLLHYYEAIYDGEYINNYGDYIEVNKTIIALKNSLDENFSRLMATDINDSWESIFGELQSEYYDDLDFKELDAVLYGDGFQQMLDYFVGTKSLFVAFESFYGDNRRSDYNVTLIAILNRYDLKIDSFPTFLEFIVNEPSTMLSDFNSSEREFTANEDYYYSKFGATTDLLKDNLHSFVAKLKDPKFQKFLETFSTSGNTIYDLLEIYYDLPDLNVTETNESEEVEENEEVLKYTRINEKFWKLLKIRPDENMESLLENLTTKYNRNSLDNFDNFLTLHENREFEEFREYYIEHDDPSPQLVSSLEVKYDETVCKQRVETESVRYSWTLESNPDEVLSTENPLVYPFYGTLTDTLVLTANRVSTDDLETVESNVEYKIDINVKDYRDLAGNKLVITYEETNTTEDNTTEVEIEEPKGDPKYRFDLELLDSSQSELNLIYGESVVVDFFADEIGLENFDDNLYPSVVGIPELFTVSIRDKNNTHFQATITANENTTGIENFYMLVENAGYSDVATVKVNVSSPVVNMAVDGVPLKSGIEPEVQLIVGEKRLIPIYAEGFRDGVSLDFEFDPLSGFTVETAGLSSFSSTASKNGATYGVYVTPQSTNAGYLEVSITGNEDDTKKGDETILIHLVPKSGTVIDLSENSCGNINLYQYESIYDTNLSGSTVPASDLNISVVSYNIYPQETYPIKYISDAYSRINLYYKPDDYVNVTSGKIGQMDIFNKNSFQKIGYINYSKEALGKSFYIKYLDEKTNSVICEKMTFPSKI
ncbi:hypothetical protein ThvES_00010660 [Thiovulum sp. ES]|nr:hypothetical protein ThvES_00010660 [Thiovulum sp. ES]